MTAKTSRQWTVSGCGFRSLGALVEEDGITFSAAVPSEENVDLILYPRGKQEIAGELPFPRQHYTGIVRTMKVAGISPEDYEYNFRVGGQVTVDPAARVVRGREGYGDFTPRGEHQVRGGFLTETFDWRGDQTPLEIPYEEVVAYHLHVRGFTKQKNSRVRHKGTFLGLQEKIPYLKELGINQVILMPAYEFDEIIRPDVAQPGGQTVPSQLPQTVSGRDEKLDDPQQAAVPGKLNFWGYVEGNYFAPKRSYCATNDPAREFKEMVRSFHESGIEVVMEFAFPDQINGAMVNDCLAWWVQEYHVDGFSLYMNQEKANTLACNPVLMRTKLMAGYFPSSSIPRGEKGVLWRNLAERNEGFLLTARKLLKGDEDQLAGFVDRVRYNPLETGVMNYITGHDGFTLMDLVSYDKKHNEANGEQGRDGAACDYSWNCGAEGPTKKRTVTRLRLRQMKNAFAMLLLAQGTPVILAGDEFGNSQQGNNNPYCHDSELTWVDWNREKANQELTSFVKELIAFRKAHGILHPGKGLSGGDALSSGYPDFSCHGSRAWYGDFDYQNRHVGLMYNGAYAGEDTFVYVAYNFHWEPRSLALPQLPDGMNWYEQMTTGDEPPREGALSGKEIQVPGRCVQILVGRRAVPEKEADNKIVSGKEAAGKASSGKGADKKAASGKERREETTASEGGQKKAAAKEEPEKETSAGRKAAKEPADREKQKRKPGAGMEKVKKSETEIE